MEIIKSNANERIKKIKKLKQKKYRDNEKKFIVEGEHLLKEALIENMVDTIVTTDYNYKNNCCKIIYVDESVMASLSSYKSISKYLVIVNYLEKKIDYSKPVVVLDGVQDPGNVGTIIRNALAFNIKNIILSKDSADIYNTKVIQASQGAIFKINIMVTDLIEEVSELKEEGYTLIGTALENALTLSKRDVYKNKMAFFFGNEGQGMSIKLIELMDVNYKIAINNIDSLNVANASAIVFYQFLCKN